MIEAHGVAVGEITRDMLGSRISKSMRHMSGVL